MVELPPEAIEAIEDGRKIRAIKCVRETYGIGLREAQDAVEDHIQKSPELAVRYQQKVSHLSGLITIVVIVVGFVCAIGYLRYW